MSALPVLPATVIGSWAFPGWYARFCEEAARDPDLYGPDDREEAVRDAVRLAVDDQLRAGADLITDGEMTRVDFNLGFYDHLSGLEPLPPARRWGAPPGTGRGRAWPAGRTTPNCSSTSSVGRWRACRRS